MKLEIGHKEIVSGLTQFLASQGISGFDPATCSVTFKQARGTGELSAVLDTDPAPVAEAPKTEAAQKTDSPVTPPATAQAAAPETQAAQAEPEVQTEAATAAPETEAAAAGGDDGLFN